ncbi:DNA-directed RNA polymerase III subunit Rpc5 [Multifurca ochricompacta]|uniref:DNA-directed RNA polymerase III subunit Rpc5 n=1 Tax=Multifurca ochricompacta TaxID=376703 RepID=A0AAD4MDB6_9AGAM|nr:DNA-directed RNA polymerase III subunit Rpc5 [Multifurca ochricompacta]
MDTDDHIVSVLPIHLSNNLAPSLQLHQYPLLNRSLEVPPSAALSGKRIRARLKPATRRLEVHVPVDPRPEVWNAEKSKELGGGRLEDDKEKNQVDDSRLREGEESRLSEVRFRSEEIPRSGAYMLGIVRDGRLHLHPFNETYQFRPTLTYLDALNRRSRGADSASDSDDGPPPDPEEVSPISAPQKIKRLIAEAKEVQVAARKAEEKGGQNLQGGLSTIRREMLMALRAEEEEEWQDLTYHGIESAESREAYEALFSQTQSGEGETLESQSNMTTFLSSIRGL